ncbi:hypothetical protein [Cohnella cholangitidis]|uniref:Uncharacterized protein n=1 Tax=Cohnella cholangitidis TaxID=2598458 RepID=A0A7G5C0K7_9BACL|nr:hypothetical protein [Cohnella cholangitidis]QMV42741.1 hypothetical protein FPL14_17265 [Cohnella cholangitidis]
MNLYRLESNPCGVDRMKRFLEDNFVSIGYPGIGDLEDVGDSELKDRLTKVYKYEGQELADRLNEIAVFVHAMQDGDYVLVVENDSVHLGDVGDYYYVETSDTMEDGLCHRRGVTWLNRIPSSELNDYVREWLSSPGAIAEFEYPLSSAQLDGWVSPNLSAQSQMPVVADHRVHVDRETIEEALEILKQALRCEDADRRERAAAAILRYAK